MGRAAVLWHGDGGRGKRGEDFSMDYTWWIRVTPDGAFDRVIGFYDAPTLDALFAA